MTDRKLKKEALIGNTVFHKGVSERLVIQRAQRDYERQQEEAPKVEALVKDVKAILAKRKKKRSD
jgi:hypothetical protein